MLLSYLAVRKIQLPFETLNEFADTSKYKLLVGKGTAHLDQFKHSHIPLFKKVWKDQIEPYENHLPLYVDLDKAILDDPQSAAYSEIGIQYGEAYLTCKIVDTGVPVSKNKLAWAISKGSPFNAAITYNFLMMKEIGVIQRFSKAYQPKTQVCPDLSGRPLTMNQCASTFIILAIGVFVCIVFLCLEGLVTAKWIGCNISLKRKYKNCTGNSLKIKSSGRKSILSAKTDWMAREKERNIDFLVKENIEMKKRICELMSENFSLKAGPNYQPKNNNLRHS